MMTNAKAVKRDLSQDKEAEILARDEAFVYGDKTGVYVYGEPVNIAVSRVFLSIRQPIEISGWITPITERPNSLGDITIREFSEINDYIIWGSMSYDCSTNFLTNEEVIWIEINPSTIKVGFLGENGEEIITYDCGWTESV